MHYLIVYIGRVVKEPELKTYWILPIILLILILVSCNISPSTAIPSTNAPESHPLQQDTTQLPSATASGNPILPINTLDYSEITPPPADANPFVKLAEQDLAERLQIAIDQINFLKITEIDWQDITKGCTTSPGQTLTKGGVSGYRIWLEANGKNYLYHIGLDNRIFVCPE